MQPCSTAHVSLVPLRGGSERTKQAGAPRGRSGARANPRTEAQFLELVSDGSSHVQHASTEALGVFASVAAVEPLLPLARNLLDS
jgi:hypothetical protein